MLNPCVAFRYFVNRYRTDRYLRDHPVSISDENKLTLLRRLRCS